MRTMRVAGRGSLRRCGGAAAADGDERDEAAIPTAAALRVTARSIRVPSAPAGGRAARTVLPRGRQSSPSCAISRRRSCSRSQERSSASSYSRPCELAKIVAVLVPRLLLGAGTGALLSGGGRRHSVPPLRPGTSATVLRSAVGLPRPSSADRQHAVRSGRVHMFAWTSIAPLATAEFLVVDTETNGLAGDACELTEIGAVLVGGGELHDRWETLLSVRTPLSRGIQRFTGISQTMVDEAPPAEAMLPEFAEQLRGPRARRAQRRVRPPRARPGVRARGPAVAEPAVAVHGRARAPLPPARAPAAPAAAGRVARDRGRGHAPRARGRGDVRARLLRALRRGCAPTRRRSGDALALLRPPRPRRRARGGHGRRRGADARRAPAAARPRRPDRRPRRLRRAQRRGAGRSTSASRSSVRARARAHFAPSSAEGGVGRAGRDRRARGHELGARRARPREPPGQAAAPAGQRAPQARRQLRLPALPPRHRLPGARGRARSGARAGR